MTGILTVFEVRWLRVHNVATFLRYCRAVVGNINDYFYWRHRYRAFMNSEKCNGCLVRDWCYENGEKLPKDKWCP